MKSSLFRLGALVLSAALTSHASAESDVGATAVAARFVDALQHQHFRDAAAMLDPQGAQDAETTERTLKRIDDSLGGFATMHPVATLPDGESIKLEVPAHVRRNAQKFEQLRYAATASDGQPVFYELNLTADNLSPQIVSFGLHIPTADGPSSKRANQPVHVISR